jgi:hypothetical protein
LGKRKSDLKEKLQIKKETKKKVKK